MEHYSRHGGSLLYDLKPLRIMLDLFISVESVCGHLDRSHVCSLLKEVSASSEGSSWDVSRVSKASQEMYLGPALLQHPRRLHSIYLDELNRSTWQISH